MCAIEIPLGRVLEIEAIIGTTVIVEDDNEVTDEDGTTVDMTDVNYTAKLKEHPGDADDDAIGDVGVGEESSILTYTLDDELTDDLEDGRRYYCTVIATFPADHAVPAYRTEPMAVRRLEVIAREG